MMTTSLLWVLWYNGYKEQIKAIYEYIKSQDVSAPYPHDLGILSEDCNKPDRILWSTLVVEFGDYGTSPRFGWIDKMERAIEYFETFFNEFGDERDCWDCER